MTQQQLKQLEKKYEITESTEARIIILKKELSLITTDYLKKAYIILKEIMKLRNFQAQQRATKFKGKGGKLYGIKHLIKEEGIKMTRHHIYYLFLQDYFSPKTKQLIEEGKIRTETILAILRRDKVYREHNIQDKIVEKYLNKELVLNEILLMHKELLSKSYDKELEKSRADRYLITIYEGSKNYLEKLRAEANLFSNEAMLKRIITTCENTIKECEQIIKFGKNIEK